jgi:hypothetical protein
MLIEEDIWCILQGKDIPGTIHCICCRFVDACSSLVDNLVYIWLLREKNLGCNQDIDLTSILNTTMGILKSSIANIPMHSPFLLSNLPLSHEHVGGSVRLIEQTTQPLSSLQVLHLRSHSTLHYTKYFHMFFSQK